MGKMERWLVPGVFAAVGVPFLAAGVVLWAVVPQAVADHAQQMERLPVSTAATLKERGAMVMLEGEISDRTPTGDQPPLVAYREYRRVTRDGETEWESWPGQTPTLWVDLPDGQVEVVAGYQLRSTPSRLEANQSLRYEGFKVGDPILVVGNLAVTRPRPQVNDAEVGYETKAGYLVALAEEEESARWLGIIFVILGSALNLGAVLAIYLLGGSGGAAPPDSTPS
ncbi:MAG TPA: hypothetical protein VLS96_03465 [Nodosilinea sp.]|nr:hypothetical protein [Nodosilinea sp.]